MIWIGVAAYVIGAIVTWRLFSETWLLLLLTRRQYAVAMIVLSATWPAVMVVGLAIWVWERFDAH